MPRRQTKPESEQSIPEMVDGLSREEVRRWYKDGKLTAQERNMANEKQEVV